MAAIVQPVTLASVDAEIVRQHGTWRYLSPTELDILIDGVVEVVALVKAGWPVDTGTSKDAWTYTIYPPSERSIGFDIENPMFYAEWVHEKGGSPEDPLWSRLIPAAVSSVMPGVVEALRRAIRATETEVARRAATSGSRPAAFLDIVRNTPLRRPNVAGLR